LLHHLGTFWDRRRASNSVLVHYADLQGDLEGEMRRLAAVLGIAIDVDAWPKLVSAAGFGQMRDRAEERAPQVKIEGIWKDARRFFNKEALGRLTRKVLLT
jgi:aryl sulfotransferase